MEMYCIYKWDTLEKLITTVHKMHNKTAWNEKLFAGKLGHWYHWYLSKNELAIMANPFLYLNMMREKYVKMYERFISQLQMYAKVIRVLLKGYLPISLATIKIAGNSRCSHKGYSNF